MYKSTTQFLIISVGLQTLIAAETKVTNSNWCRHNCIDKGLDFCASSDMKSGYCCNSIECPSHRKNVSLYCSSDMAPNLNTLACPIDERCGESKIIEAKPVWTQLLFDK